MSKPVKPKQKVVFNPIENKLEFVTDNNFSYESVPQNKKLVINENNQMTVHEEFQNDGDLELLGSLILED